MNEYEREELEYSDEGKAKEVKVGSLVIMG